MFLFSSVIFRIQFIKKSDKWNIYIVRFYKLGLLFVSNPMAPTVNNLSVALFVFISFFPSTLSIILKYPAIINFGDSNSDTGNLISAGIESVYPPYGQTYFKLPSGRYCDGRLIVDFLCIYKLLQMHTNCCCSSLKQLLIWNSLHINCFDVLQWMQWTCHF